MSSTPTTQPAPASTMGSQGTQLTFRQRLGRWDQKASPYVYIAPFFLIWAITGLFPLVYTAFVSVHKWGLLQGNKGFVGLDNYTWVLGQERFWKGMRNTFSIFLLSSVPQVVAALLLAWVLDANLRARTFWRMGVLLPYVVAPIAVSLIFGQLFADQSGVVNAVLAKLGMSPIGWHRDVLASHFAIATMVNFRWTGYNTLIFLAAMQAIPRETIEAAIVDGASRVRTFLNVTIPMLRPTIVFIIITSTIGGLQIFDEPRMFDTSGGGGADRQWMTVTMYMYELGWGSQRSLGRASAVAWILFLVVVLFALLNFYLTRRIAGTDSAPHARKRKEAHR